MKILQAMALLIVAFVAFSACAFGSPPTSTKEKPAIVQAHSIDKQQVSPISIQTDVDGTLAMPIERTDIAGEIAKAQRYERRFEIAPDKFTLEWIGDVPTPPNEIAFNGYGNVRPREQV
jgi:hypothetical protein